eukprot:TRINITY_DN1817_c0_g1_i1.p1 TRINITY_DN1817_c0_g1~~TRINITY_DN1817_c0_g1_i1.p1  ORF type:complete len:527 (+),score=135.92 TRINITY_DN1817_c0_g1_i1:103-1683(+)
MSSSDGLSSNEEYVAKIQAHLADLSSGIAGTEQDMDVFWFLLGGCLVFFMQCGFGLLEAGCVRSTSVVNIMFKNVMDACIGAFFFYMLGYALAFGNDDSSKSHNGFIGNAKFFLMSNANGGLQDGFAAVQGFDPYEFAKWFFQYAFCATAATIVSGAMAERTQLVSYFVYSAWICGFVYPVVVHWCWSDFGWASPFGGTDRIGMGLLDFAGSAVVHMVGGFSALAGAIVIGQRRGKEATEDGTRLFRFDEGANPADFTGHNKVFQTLGMFILWTGWFGFNCVSTGTLNGGGAKVAAKVAVTTVMGAAGGSFACLVSDVIWQRFLSGVEIGVEPSPAWVAWREANGEDTADPPQEAFERGSVYDLGMAINGVLAGLVSITAGCAMVEPWAALVIGMCGGVIYYATSSLMIRVKVDDPLDAFAVHGMCGFWGTIAVGLWATKSNVAAAYGQTHADNDYYGAFYGAGGDQFGIQIVVALTVAAWSFVLSLACFLILNALGKLRADDANISFEKQGGLDAHEHNTAAYAK